ncbi:MAG: GNAT family N-acetyltransferase [Flavobacteriales bacterium]|nr:GNAT family N-acetyltransferase [Flavobacteriales bacterium]
MSDAKRKYNALAVATAELPIFMQPWWLDAVVENNAWDVALIEEAKEIKACFVYVLKKKGPFTAIGIPTLTPYLGFWFDAKVNPVAAAEQLISMLPRHDKFYMKMHYEASNTPLSMPGFRKEPLYTYTLSNTNDHDSLYSNFKSNLKGKIRQANGALTIVESNDVNKLYDLCQMSFTRQNKEADFSLNLVQRIYNAVSSRGCGTILMVKDQEDKVHAATLVVWDQNCAYYLINGLDPAFRPSGGGSLLMWEVIKHASQFCDTFDFEGSMIPGVEAFIKGFGAKKRDYFLYTKTNSKVIGAVEGFKKRIRR